jgi:two-component system sensor histidine kinase ChiS
MLSSLAQYNKNFIENKLPSVELGLGLHTGKVMMGTVGTSSRMDATVISDTVNVASRVESMTKAFSTKLLITDETKQELANISQYKIRYIANCHVPGKTNKITLYEVFNNDPLSLQQEKLQNQPGMIKAWKIYKGGDKQQAIELYQKLIEKSPSDKSLFSLIERCQSGRL